MISNDTKFGYEKILGLRGDRTGQDRTGQDRTGQDRTGQDKKTITRSAS